MSESDIEGLPKYDWRVSDGVIQRRVKVKLDVDYTDKENQDPRILARKLTEFADTHVEARADIEHKYEDHPDYSCETWLELVGWREATKAEVDREKLRVKGERRTQALQEQRRLEEQLERTRRALEDL